MILHIPEFWELKRGCLGGPGVRVIPKTNHGIPIIAVLGITRKGRNEAEIRPKENRTI